VGARVLERARKALTGNLALVGQVRLYLRRVWAVVHLLVAAAETPLQVPVAVVAAAGSDQHPSVRVALDTSAS
jgi:hypothetical protein